MMHMAFHPRIVLLNFFSVLFRVLLAYSSLPNNFAANLILILEKVHPTSEIYYSHIFGQSTDNFIIKLSCVKTQIVIKRPDRAKDTGDVTVPEFQEAAGDGSESVEYLLCSSVLVPRFWHARCSNQDRKKVRHWLNMTHTDANIFKIYCFLRIVWQRNYYFTTYNLDNEPKLVQHYKNQLNSENM